MTTDTKAVARWEYYDGRHVVHPDGPFVRFTDHERVVGELRDAMFAVYSVAANGGSLSRLHTEIERMRDAMEKGNV